MDSSSNSCSATSKSSSSVLVQLFFVLEPSYSGLLPLSVLAALFPCLWSCLPWSHLLLTLGAPESSPKSHWSGWKSVLREFWDNGNSTEVQFHAGELLRSCPGAIKVKSEDFQRAATLPVNWQKLPKCTNTEFNSSTAKYQIARVASLKHQWL